MATALWEKGVFTKAVIDEPDITGPTLKFVSTIVEYENGGDAVRYFAGVYGGGQPKIKIRFSVLDATATKGKFEIERRGEGAGARVGGAFISDKDIQAGDILDLAADFAEFVNATAKHSPRDE